MEISITVIVIAVALVVLIGLIAFVIVNRVPINGKIAGDLLLETLKAANSNPALLDSIEGNRTSIPASIFLVTTQSLVAGMRIALLVDPNSPNAGKAHEALDQLEKFAHNISDGVFSDSPASTP